MAKIIFVFAVSPERKVPETLRVWDPVWHKVQIAFARFLMSLDVNTANPVFTF